MSRPTFDKFGHYRGIKAKDGAPGRGFVLDERGNYDMQEKVLTNLQDPEEEQDAVTRSYLKRKLDTCIQFDATNAGFNCRRGKLLDVNSPEGDNDGVNLGFLKEKTINSLGDGIFDAKKMRLKNVADPQNKFDAVNLGYIKNKTLYYVEKEGYDAKGKRIKDLADPQVKGDGVNLNFIQTKTLNCKENEEFDGRNKRIKGVAAPVENQDCVNLAFLKENTLNSLAADISAKDKKIVQLKEGSKGDDAVNIALLVKLIQFSAFVAQQDLTDAMIEIRREIHELRDKKYTKKEIQTRLNSLDGSFKRDWRSALHAGEAKKMSDPEFAQICSILGINKETLALFAKK